MAALRPEISKALQAAGLDSPQDSDLKKQLEHNDLGVSATISRLAELTENADSDSVRLRAIELAAKMHGFLKEAGASMAPIIVQINDPKADFSVNPILVPRAA